MPNSTVFPTLIHPAYHLTGSADGHTPLVLASPHSGRLFPPDFLETVQLPTDALRRLEDAHVGELLQPASTMGIPLFKATHARAVLDLNRAVSEYDPAMLDGPLPVPPERTARVANGYGLFPKIAGPGQIIHKNCLSAAVAQQRITDLHQVWHAALAAALQAARNRHGQAILLDVHSMPSLKSTQPARIVLGDCHGSSAAAPLVARLQAAFEDAGLKTVRNTPYAGGHTTLHHGRPEQGIHAVQIEIDRGLYMDQHSLIPHGGFAKIAAMLARIIGQLRAALPLPDLGDSIPLAAE